MFSTGLTEQEKESLIKWLCIQGTLVQKEDGNYIFRIGNTELDASDFSPGKYLKDAVLNISKQVHGR